MLGMEWDVARQIGFPFIDHPIPEYRENTDKFRFVE
jgi:hypothetical protein